VYSYRRFWKQYNELSQTEADIELEVAPQVTIVEGRSKASQSKPRVQLAPKSKVSSTDGPAKQLSDHNRVAVDLGTLHMDKHGVIRIVDST
jgi:hypothetical protein